MESKRCAGKCKLRLPVDAFDMDRSAPSGRQSWCKQCKDDHETTLEGIYSRTISWLEKNEPESAVRWTLDRFRDKWEQSAGRCYHCGAGLREWQKAGHSLDRIDNVDCRHIPENCVLSCAPCNMTRGRITWHAWRKRISLMRAEHHGEIPWGQEDPKWKRIIRRVTRHLALPDHQPGLPGLFEARNP